MMIIHYFSSEYKRATNKFFHSIWKKIQSQCTKDDQLFITIAKPLQKNAIGPKNIAEN